MDSLFCSGSAAHIPPVHQHSTPSSEAQADATLSPAGPVYRPGVSASPDAQWQTRVRLSLSAASPLDYFRLILCVCVCVCVCVRDVNLPLFGGIPLFFFYFPLF